MLLVAGNCVNGTDRETPATGLWRSKSAVYHSGMADSTRAEMWRKQEWHESLISRGVLGAVSVFLPYKQLGLVIVDEEHESSYKQKEPAPSYNDS